MICSKCGSGRVVTQTVNEVSEKARHGAIYWLLIGWWFQPLLWILFFPIKLIASMVGKRGKIISETNTYAVCQECGHKWKL